MPATIQPPGSGRGSASSRWKDIYLVLIYRYARAGLTNEQIAGALKITAATIYNWMKKKTVIREVLKLARQEVPEEESYSRFFYDRLPPAMQDLWEQVLNVERTGGGMAALNDILADHGVRARQVLFLHALMVTHFSPTKAMAMVGIDHRQLNTWKMDPDFADEFDKVQHIKGDYFEGKLVQLVEAQDRGAILFANRTFNRQRGYGQTADVNVHHTGDIGVNMTALDLSDLDLSLPCRLEIANAIRKREEQLAQQRLFQSQPLDERLRIGVEQALAGQISESEA
jgi:hypothetical protein